MNNLEVVEAMGLKFTKEEMKSFNEFCKKHYKLSKEEQKQEMNKYVKIIINEFYYPYSVKH